MTYFSSFKAERTKQLCSVTRTCDHGHVSQDEGDYSRGLLDLILALKPKSVIEVGSYRGVSTELFLLHCPRVVAVDPWEWPPDNYKEFMERVGEYPGLEACRGFSPAALSKFSREFDMCYIDGDHSYEAVKADILACKGVVKIDGWIAGHDWNNPETRRAILDYAGEPKQVFSDASWYTHNIIEPGH